MRDIKLKSGRTVKVYSDIDEVINECASDKEMDLRAVEAVKAAINKAKICKKPIAYYDKERKCAYIEYAGGEKRYEE